MRGCEGTEGGERGFSLGLRVWVLGFRGGKGVQPLIRVEVNICVC